MLAHALPEKEELVRGGKGDGAGSAWKVRRERVYLHLDGEKEAAEKSVIRDGDDVDPILHRDVLLIVLL